MKVSGPSSATPSGASKGARPASSGGFSLGGAAPAVAATRTAATGPVASLEALIALQEVGGPLERRRRAMGRASRILDVLDEVKEALLGGELSPDALERLTRAVRDQRESTDDPGLEAVLDEIETRAAVEMAKLEMSSVAA
jgi:hypothetical protein